MIAAGLLLLAIGVVVGFIVSGWIRDSSSDALGAAKGSASTPDATFSISGNVVTEIAPGRSASIDLTLTNNLRTPMTVTNLKVTIASVSAPSSSALLPCTAADFIVSQTPPELELLLPPGTSSTLDALDVPSAQWPTLTMKDSDANQDGCKGAILTLRYEGSARVER